MATQHGYFLIADITGYTHYLSESELDHAQKTLTALLNLLISRTKPPLVISRLAGDAVISYGLGDNFLQGQTFLELIEDTYVAFRRQIELMVRNTTCPCNACRNIGSLDLKFFVHFGEFGLQRLDAHEELVGSDVNLIHRLLKNHVTERTGLKAYALYTAAAIAKLGLEEAAARFITNEESYEDLGTVETFIEDMHPVWDAKRDEAQVRVTPERELARFSTLIRLSPEQVWDYLVQPEHYNVFAGGNRTELANLKDGRLAPGSAYQCYHGESFMTQTILEWRPFSRIVVQASLPIPIKGSSMLFEVDLDPVDGGTRFTQIVARATGPLAARLMANFALKRMSKQAQMDVDNFAAHIERDFAAKGGTAPDNVPIAESLVSQAARESLISAGSSEVA